MLEPSQVKRHERGREGTFEEVAAVGDAVCPLYMNETALRKQYERQRHGDMMKYHATSFGIRRQRASDTVATATPDRICEAGAYRLRLKWCPN